MLEKNTELNKIDNNWNPFKHKIKFRIIWQNL